MADSPLKVIIIGAGLIGPRHAASVQSHPSTEVLAFIDPSPSAQAIGTDFNVPVYASLDELPIKPDAAVVCTPNHTHIPLTLSLLDQGIKNILLEKPISDSIETAAPLLSALSHPSNKDVKILVGHHRRFNPYTLSLKKLIESGSLGTILSVSGLWTLLKPPSYFSGIGGWRSDREKGGVLGINLIHDIDLLQYLLGPVIRVYAEESTPQRIQQKGNEEHTHTAEEGVALTLRFESGVVGTFLVSDCTPAPWNFEVGTGENPNVRGVIGESDGIRDCYRVLGTSGCVSFPDLTVFNYRGVSAGEEKGWNIPLSATKLPVEGKEIKPFDTQWGHFVDVVEGKEEVACSVEDGVRALRVVRGVRESMESGQPVEIKA
ncbi:hypothetical protein BDV06DRAFT_222292 [Aspergillus oleicola]